MQKFDPLIIAEDFLGINDKEKLLNKRIKYIRQLSDNLSKNKLL